MEGRGRFVERGSESASLALRFRDRLRDAGIPHHSGVTDRSCKRGGDAAVAGGVVD